VSGPVQKVAIITDSIACLTEELVQKYQIGIVPILLYVQGKMYRDMLDITPSESYELFMKDPDSFNSSPSSPTEYLEAYREASEKAESILCITLSSLLSTSYNTACLAKEEAKTVLPGVTIQVMDSRNATAAEGFVVLAAARSAAEGKDLTEVVRAAEEVKSKATFLIAVDTLAHVYRTGRIPKVASQIGSLLNIRPILTISGGQVRFKAMTRSREHGIRRILKCLSDQVGQRPVHIAVMHAYAPDEAEELKNQIESDFNCAELWVTGFSLVMGYATGTGTLGFAYYCDDQGYLSS